MARVEVKYKAVASLFKIGRIFRHWLLRIEIGAAFEKGWLRFLRVALHKSSRLPSPRSRSKNISKPSFRRKARLSLATELTLSIIFKVDKMGIPKPPILTSYML